jgi:putative membrane protein
MMWGSGWAGWVVGLVMMTLFWVGIVAAIYVAVRTTRGSSRTASGRSTPLDILAERFARGEISTEEFEERRNIIRTHTG